MSTRELAMRDLEWEACLIEPRPDRALERRIRRESGFVGSTVAYFGSPEWVASAVARFNHDLRHRVKMSQRLANLVGLAVSQDNSCRYCYAVHRAMMRGVGYPNRDIARLEQLLHTGDLEPKERAALDFTRRLSRSNPLVGPSDLRALRGAGFDPSAVAELVSHVGLFVFFNRLSTLLALPPQRVEMLAHHPLAVLAQPVIGPWMRRLIGSAEPMTLREEQTRGPFAAVVLAFDGLPMAISLQAAMRDAFASAVVPARTKALMFAIVARALGCTHSEQEALRLAAAEGVAEEEASFVVAHLSSPSLSPLEALVFPFARDTVRYGQPAPIQRRTREVADALTREELVEVVAVISLANLVCRMGAVIGGC